jgi:small-conductance mechanosensitive channel
VFLGSLLILEALKAILVRRSRRVAERTGRVGWTTFRSLCEATALWFIVLTSVYFASLLLALPPQVSTSLRLVEVTSLLIQAALWGNVTLRLFTMRWVERRREEDPASAPFTALVGYAGRVVLWTIVLLLILENAGIEVTALLTGLGIGGIAIALAVQNILGDLFASLTIVVDKPFVIGDFIVVGTEKGTVEHIGLKTTRVRSLSGEQLVFPNSDLLQSRIRNFQRMDERRASFKVGVLYETPPDKLAALPAMIREIVEAQSPVRFDRAHFQGFGESSLDFEVVYFVLSPDYNTFMDIQQAINLELIRRCNAAGIGFAYPTRTLYMQQVGGNAEANENPQ